MQQAGEDRAVRVRVLHIAPAGNIELRRVKAPAFQKIGSDALKVFQSLLTEPDDFVSRTTEELFRPFVHGGGGADVWTYDLKQRYAFLLD